MTRLEAAVKFMLDTAADDSHGYDQANRNGPDYDCSSLVSTALFNAGFAISPQSYTGNMLNRLITCGFTKIYQGPWKPGDVHLTPGRHTCMSVSETEIVEASINELGKITGGKTGDQTGKEIAKKPYYVPKYGWSYHLRYDKEDMEALPLYSTDTIAREVIAGKWGNGEERKRRLSEAGYIPDTVQLRVNQFLQGKGKFLDEVAREVIKGKWGNGEERTRRLTEANYNPIAVQKRVNEILHDVGGR